jgi:hypothetical protein
MLRGLSVIKRDGNVKRDVYAKRDGDVKRDECG